MPRIFGSEGAGESIDGGNSLLPEAMIAAITDLFDYRHTLDAMSKRDYRLRLHFQSPAGDSTHDVAPVVLAIPIAALRKVNIDSLCQWHAWQ